MITLNTLYWLINICALSGWMVLFLYRFLPLRAVTIASIWIPLGLSAGYGITLVFAMPYFSGGFGSLDALIDLFNQPVAVLAGWIHYLAFDLFLGGWQVRRARKLKLPVAMVIPCLLLTLLFGPLGLLVFCLVQWWWQDREQGAGKVECSFTN